LLLYLLLQCGFAMLQNPETFSRLLTWNRGPLVAALASACAWAVAAWGLLVLAGVLLAWPAAGWPAAGWPGVVPVCVCAVAPG
jgi:hypothetical protein